MFSRSGGFLNSARAYMRAHKAAVRIETRVLGRLKPIEDDLRVLGIEHTAAYAAVTRH
jgi:hypothetical protein